ncbi:MAG TPA: hypothetical protein VMC09_09905 [Anaerolineales bacterium]|nr:hypothetical protein [Anaerolineales bacterium]
MEWKVSFLPDQQIVVIQTFGDADDAGSIEMAKGISKTMMKYKALRCLIDHSALVSVSGSSGVYYRPSRLLGIGIPLKLKVAEVVLPAHKEHFAFLETVCRNRGINFSVFSDRESAIQWLTE